MDPISNASAEFLVTQGILGVTTLALAAVVIYLWRDGKEGRKQYDADLVEERTRHNAEFLAERTRHATEIASERKLNAELQEARFRELKAALEAVESVTETVKSAIAVLSGRTQ